MEEKQSFRWLHVYLYNAERLKFNSKHCGSYPQGSTNPTLSLQVRLQNLRVSHNNIGEILVVQNRTFQTFSYYDKSKCLLNLTYRPHLLFLWAVQGSCRVENSLLGVVEQLRDVLQVFGRALRKKRAHVCECPEQKQCWRKIIRIYHRLEKCTQKLK